MALSLTDILKMNNAEMGEFIEEQFVNAPELTFAGGLDSARPINGTGYNTLVRTAWPNVAFKKPGEGVTIKSSTYENRRVETATIEQPIMITKDRADRAEDGPAEVMALEASGVMGGTRKTLSQQFYNGVVNDANGFIGCKGAVHSDMVHDAAGTGSAVSDVWAVKFGPTFCQWQLGKNGSMGLGDVREQLVEVTTGKWANHLVQDMLFYPGLAFKHKYCIGCIKNLTAAKTLTGAMLGTLYDKFVDNLGMVPDAFFMDTRSRRQYQNTLTATSPTGAEAPIPTEYENIPIIPTAGIGKTNDAW